MLSGEEEITGQWREITLGKKKVKTSEGEKETHLIFQKEALSAGDRKAVFRKETQTGRNHSRRQRNPQTPNLDREAAAEHEGVRTGDNKNKDEKEFC